MNAVVQHEPRSLARDENTTATPAQLLAMAVQQGADIDKLEKLMALQERWDANESRKAFTVALTAFKAEPLEIIKAKHVSFVTQKGTTEYNHAELSDITDVVGPALARHDLSFRWNVMQKDGAVAVECILTHVAGHSEKVMMNAPPDASGGKNSIQQIASTTTYLQRYTLLAITGMSTKGADDDGRRAESSKDDVDPSWHAAINDAIDETELKNVKAEMLKTWKVVESVPRVLVKAWEAKRELLRSSTHG